jgi:hypothetical protein
MLGFGSAGSRTRVDLVPDESARTWVIQGLAQLAARLGPPAARPQLVLAPDGLPTPRDLDGLFDLLCAVQEQIDQADVEFTLLEVDDRAPELPPGFTPLGDPNGKLLQTLARGDERVMLFSRALFRVPPLLYAGVARELGHLAVLGAGGPAARLPADRDADAELAGIALGMGVWVTNGAYVFENACCGGGCGVDLRRIRAGLSMPEAAFALALDGRRKGLPRRSIARHLEPTQRAAFKDAWRVAPSRLPALGPTTIAGELGS